MPQTHTHTLGFATLLCALFVTCYASFFLGGGTGALRRPRFPRLPLLSAFRRLLLCAYYTVVHGCRRRPLFCVGTLLPRCVSARASFAGCDGCCGARVRHDDAIRDVPPPRPPPIFRVFMYARLYVKMYKNALPPSGHAANRPQPNRMAFRCRRQRKHPARRAYGLGLGSLSASRALRCVLSSGN